MSTCAVCTADLRLGARFCTRCGSPVAESVLALAPEIPARVPVTGRITAPPARSAAAMGALLAGVAPLVISIVGNLAASALARAALADVDGAAAEGAWAPVLLVLAAVFVLTAGSLTVCVMLGVRGLRETATGETRGRGLAVAGLAVGGVNLVLWVAGIIVTVSGLGSILG